MHEEAVITKWYIVHDAFLSIFLFESNNLFFLHIFYFSISKFITFTKVLSPVNELFITCFKSLVFPLLLLSSVKIIKTWLDTVLHGPVPV